MLKSTCALGCTFSLISWLSGNQSRHNIYQIKLNSSAIEFVSFNYFNVDSSFNIKSWLLKISVVILDMMMQGTVSQIFYFYPSSCFM